MLLGGGAKPGPRLGSVGNLLPDLRLPAACDALSTTIHTFSRKCLCRSHTFHISRDSHRVHLSPSSPPRISLRAHFRTKHADQDLPHRDPRHPGSCRTGRHVSLSAAQMTTAVFENRALKLFLRPVLPYLPWFLCTARMWLGLPELVAAVSNAGGLGILTGLTAGSPENLRESECSGWRLTEASAGWVTWKDDMF